MALLLLSAVLGSTMHLGRAKFCWVQVGSFLRRLIHIYDEEAETDPIWVDDNAPGGVLQELPPLDAHDLELVEFLLREDATMDEPPSLLFISPEEERQEGGVGHIGENIQLIDDEGEW